MGSDLFAGSEIFGDQGGGHHQRVSGVHETLAGGTVPGEFPSGIEGIDPREISDGECIFGVVEASQDDRARVSSAGFRGLIECSLNRVEKSLAIGRCRLRLISRGHLAERELFDRGLPDLGMLHQLAQRCDLFEVDIAFVFFRGMATQTIFFDHRADRLVKNRRVKRAGLRADERVRNQAARNQEKTCEAREPLVQMGGHQEWFQSSGPVGFHSYYNGDLPEAIGFSGHNLGSTCFFQNFPSADAALQA